MKTIKTIRSYNGVARFLAECTQDETGECAQSLYMAAPADAPSSRYAFRGLTIVVYQWNSKNVTLIETAHRRYEVIDVGQPVLYSTDEQAEAVALAAR